MAALRCREFASAGSGIIFPFWGVTFVVVGKDTQSCFASTQRIERTRGSISFFSVVDNPLRQGCGGAGISRGGPIQLPPPQLVTKEVKEHREGIVWQSWLLGEWWERLEGPTTDPEY